MATKPKCTGCGKPKGAKGAWIRIAVNNKEVQYCGDCWKEKRTEITAAAAAAIRSFTKMMTDD